MGPVLLLPPVAEVLVFPLDRLLPLPPATTLLPLPPSTCSGSYGWAWARLPQTRALRHPVPPPPSLPPHQHCHHHPFSPLSLSSLFSFVQPILLGAVWFTQAWETCDHSAGYQELQAGSVFGGGGREGRRKTIWHNQPIIRTFCSTWENIQILPENTN